VTPAALTTVVLDTTPLSLLAQRVGVFEADRCRQWYASLAAAGWPVLVPEIADYEVRRELVRAKKIAGVARLDAFNAAMPGRYLPLTTPVLRLAADLWAQARQAGQPTAPDAALDGDVILAAQVLTLGLRPGSVVVATSNVGHIGRFTQADLWQNIAP